MRTPMLKSKRASRAKVVTGTYPDVAHRLMEDYRVFWAQCTSTKQRRVQHYLSDIKATDERLQVLSDLAAWCAEQKIDPRLWLFVCFRKAGWFWPPKITLKCLAKPAIVPIYHKAKGLDGYRRMVQKHTVAPRFDPNIDIAPAVEARKARLVEKGQAAECMAAMIDGTWGYHPKSRVCSGCPLADECAQRLEHWCGFPVVNLREGKITKEQAQAIALGQVQG